MLIPCPNVIFSIRENDFQSSFGIKVRVVAAAVVAVVAASTALTARQAPKSVPVTS